MCMKVLEFSCISGKDKESIYFKLENGKGKVYEERFVVSEGEILAWNCNCLFGSAYRFSKDNEEKNVKCKHIKYLIRVMKYLGYLKK